MVEPTYTVFIRVPIPRGEFVDPPPVNWDAKKDEDLWNILSGAAKQEINWTKLAEQFEVTVDFLLQQVAYLSERHASQLRAQVRKATAAAKTSSAPSPIPGAEAGGSIGGGGGHQRTTSALSVRRDSPLPRNNNGVNTEGSGPGTPVPPAMRPNISRNPSTKTTVAHNLAGGGSSPRLGKEGQQHRRRLSSLPIASPKEALSPPSPGPLESSSAASDSEESSPAQSRIIRRPPRFQPGPGVGSGSLGDEDEDTEPAFAAAHPQTSSAKGASQDLGATLKGDPRDFGKRLPKSGKERTYQSQTSDSSASSAALVSRVPASGDRRQPPGPLSPRRAAELAGKKSPPGSRGKGYSREGSDGTPSMGSSFSDLDDASVTQSALEEALASKMQDGAIGSRFSISQAFKSRYGPTQSQRQYQTHGQSQGQSQNQGQSQSQSSNQNQNQAGNQKQTQ